MGYYIDTDTMTSATGKAAVLVAQHGASLVGKPLSLDDLPDEKALVCVVENGFFDAAAFIFSNSELEEFSNPTDYRPKTWLTMDKDMVHKLTGYTG